MLRRASRALRALNLEVSGEASIFIAEILPNAGGHGWFWVLGNPAATSTLTLYHRRLDFKPRRGILFAYFKRELTVMVRSLPDLHSCSNALNSRTLVQSDARTLAQFSLAQSERIYFDLGRKSRLERTTCV